MCYQDLLSCGAALHTPAAGVLAAAPPKLKPPAAEDAGVVLAKLKAGALPPAPPPGWKQQMKTLINKCTVLTVARVQYASSAH